MQYVASSDQDDKTEALGLTHENREKILMAVDAAGLITDLIYHPGGGFYSFNIPKKVLQAARAIHAEEAKQNEPRDIVAELHGARQRAIRFWLYVIIAPPSGSGGQSFTAILQRP